MSEICKAITADLIVRLRGSLWHDALPAEILNLIFDNLSVQNLFAAAYAAGSQYALLFYSKCTAFRAHLITRDMIPIISGRKHRLYILYMQNLMRSIADAPYDPANYDMINRLKSDEHQEPCIVAQAIKYNIINYIDTQIYITDISVEFDYNYWTHEEVINYIGSPSIIGHIKNGNLRHILDNSSDPELHERIWLFTHVYARKLQSVDLVEGWLKRVPPDNIWKVNAPGVVLNEIYRTSAHARKQADAERDDIFTNIVFHQGFEGFDGFTSFPFTLEARIIVDVMNNIVRKTPSLLVNWEVITDAQIMHAINSLHYLVPVSIVNLFLSENPVIASRVPKLASTYTHGIVNRIINYKSLRDHKLFELYAECVGYSNDTRSKLTKMLLSELVTRSTKFDISLDYIDNTYDYRNQRMLYAIAVRSTELDEFIYEQAMFNFDIAFIKTCAN